MASVVLSIEYKSPGLAADRRGDSKLPVLRSRVEQQQKTVARLRRIRRVTSRPSGAGPVKKNSQALAPVIVPIRFQHLSAVLHEPGDIFHTGIRMYQTLQKCRAAKHGMIKSQTNKFFNKGHRFAIAIFLLPVNP